MSQPAIYVASLAAVEKLRAEEGGQAVIDAADVAAGLSLGEYTALAFAGAFSFEDGLRIVKARGEAMQVRGPGGAGRTAMGAEHNVLITISRTPTVTANRGWCTTRLCSEDGPSRRSLPRA